MKVIETFLDIIAPYDCVVCQKEGPILCDTCALESCPTLPSCCYRCKKLTTDYAVCESCRQTSNLRNLWVRAEYANVAKKLIYQMKFRSNRQACEVIAGLMMEALPTLPSDTIVVDIPTATTRKRSRGYDHSRRIAQNIARGTGLEHVSALSRLGQARQVGKGREARLKQLNNAFYVKKDVQGRSLLLVDDIVTTGGTLESAAVELRKAGAKKVYAVVFAQK